MQGVDMDTDRVIIGDATYSPEDNKLRLYPYARLDTIDYERVKEAGFKWAPKQELFVAPMWTPSREDLLIELCGEIGDEDTSLVERAEERAERFEELSDKREQDAQRTYDHVTKIADAIPLGQPILVGHHSERMARKHAEKIKDGMSKAVSMWETSKYWEDRAKGAIRHAKHKELPAVRARRIKGIEADRRKSEKTKQEAEIWVKAWTDPDKELTRKRALAMTNICTLGTVVTLADGTECWSAWSALEDEKITPEEVRDQLVPKFRATTARCQRWIDHYDNRLAYERAMLGEQGGLPTDRVKPEKGGAIKCWINRGDWIEIRKVNKTSVSVPDITYLYAGPKEYLRKIKFDEVAAIMSKADYDAYKAGQNSEAVAQDLEQAQERAERARERREQAEADQGSVFEQMKETLRQGVQVVSAPQLLPTPVELAKRMVELADVKPGQRVLEPSAGTGNLIAPIVNAFMGLDCGRIVAVELNCRLAENLRQDRQKRLYANDETYKIVNSDFLECNGDLGTFHRIVMNPPFENAVDIKHILHAYSMLKPGGKLVALCANGPRQREKLQPMASYWEDLPEGTFASQGTNVNVALLVIDRPEQD